MPGPETLTALLIAAGALAAAVRLLLARRGWQGAVLAALSLASGGALWLTLFPPLLPVGGATLVIATAEAPASVRPQAGERLVALPEAPAIAGAERVPDLATALRRYGEAQRLRIIGRGLPPRDLDMAAGLPTAFTPMPLPRGLIRLDPPADTPAGSMFALGGAASGLGGGTAELLDPAGRLVDSRMIAPDGAFALGSTARAEGLATFTLRLRGQDKAIHSDTPVPLRTLAAPAPLRVMLIGAPSPEAKYLRRWAEDAGFALASQLDAGGGVNLGEGGAQIDPGRLRETDVVIIDDAALARIGGGARSALAQAVRGGLGVVVRMTGPATAASRQNWRALGLVAEAGSEAIPIALPPPASDADALAFRRGPGSADAPGSLNTLDDPAPELGRWAIRAGADFVPAVSDDEGGVLAGWQQQGQGRVLLWTAANSFALVLGGQADRYEQWWSAALSAVPRPDGMFRADLPPLPTSGQRLAICGLAGVPTVKAPDAGTVTLAIDPLAGPRGCAAYWPTEPGVHTIVQPGEDGAQTFAFLVLPQTALPAIRARETGEATALWAAAQSAPTTRADPQRRGPAWPWFLGWLIISAALWVAERRWRGLAKA